MGLLVPIYFQIEEEEKQGTLPFDLSTIRAWDQKQVHYLHYWYWNMVLVPEMVLGPNKPSQAHFHIHIDSHFHINFYFHSDFYNDFYFHFHMDFQICIRIQNQ